MRATSIFYPVLLSIIAVFVSSVIIMTPADGVSCPSGACKQGGDTLTASVTPTSGSSPLQVNYKAHFASGSSTMKGVVWNFGDAGSSNTANGTHTYQSAGNYTATVDADAKDGTSYTQTFFITVTGSIGPTATSLANATVPNPSAGQMNAYKYIQQEHNGSLSTTNQPPLAVTTDALSYQQGNTVVIHGSVKNVSNQTAVTVRIVNGLKNLVSIAQLVPASDGSFSTKVLATGPLWTKAGNYTIIAQYGPALNTTAIFQYAGGDGTNKIAQSPTSTTYSLSTPAGTFVIPYTITGGDSVQSMQVIGDTKTLVVTINAASDGTLSIDLPRTMIDAKQLITSPTGSNSTSTTQVSQSDLPDGVFIVDVGSQKAQFTEVKTSTTRTLGISFHKGDTTIDIIGTVSVPEFGAIAALVLAIAIVSIIAVSAKTGLRLMPRY